MKIFTSLFNPFRKPSAADIARINLEDYERRLIAEEAAAAYHRKMAEYYKEGITRLQHQAI